MARRWLPLLVLPLLAVACGGDDDGAAATSTSARPPASASPVTTGSAATPSTEPAGVQPEGFGTVAGRVTGPDGATCDVCLWEARTAEEQARGLMGVTDLGGADGMVFRYESPVTSQFWMRDTLLPLSIAFYGEDGAFVSATDMAPCAPDVADADCPRYAATGPYVNAVEVAQGGLDALLMVPGSTLTLLDTPCPLAS